MSETPERSDLESSVDHKRSEPNRRLEERFRTDSGV